MEGVDDETTMRGTSDEAKQGAGSGQSGSAAKSEVTAGHVAHQSMWRHLRKVWVLTALLSLPIYCATVLSLQQDRSSNWSAEITPLASAYSNVLYDAPLATYYVGVLAYLLNAPAPKYDALERLGRHDARRRIPKTLDCGSTPQHMATAAEFRLATRPITWQSSATANRIVSIILMRRD